MNFEIKVTSTALPSVKDVQGGAITITDNADGTYQFTSNDVITAFKMDANKDKITKIEIITEELTSLDSAFNDCSIMTEFIAPATAFGLVTDFSGAWGNCLVLTSFPMIDTSKGTTFEGAWYRCQALTSFPLLDTSKGTNFGGAWRHCSELTSFPALNTSSATKFYMTWSGCAKLTSFPLLDSSNVTEFGAAWEDCAALKCIKGINTTAATGVYQMFLHCSNLCRPNATERTAIEATPGIAWVSDVPDGEDCCTWEPNKFEIKVTATALPGVSDVQGGSISVTDNGDGTYQLESTDGITAFKMGANKAYVSKIEIITEELTSLSHTFESSQRLVQFIAPATAFSLVTDFSHAWSACSAMTSFPIIDTSNGTNFDSAWRTCFGLSSFPLLDVSKGTNFSYAWYGCSSLTSFPLLDVSKGTSFYRAWSSCRNLTSFPLLDVSKGTYFAYAWSGCSSLTSFPLLDVSKGTNFDSAWGGCGKLTSFPLLDVSKGTNFKGTWRNNKKLTSLPALDFSKGTNFGGAWQGCIVLKCMAQIDATSATNMGYVFDNTPALCRPNATERNNLIGSHINWVNNTPDGEDCCTWTPPVTPSLGDKEIKDAYLGTMIINKIYLGNNKVWEKTSPKH